jgi:hypothetical protein
MWNLTQNYTQKYRQSEIPCPHSTLLAVCIPRSPIKYSDSIPCAGRPTPFSGLKLGCQIDVQWSGCRRGVGVPRGRARRGVAWSWRFLLAWLFLSILPQKTRTTETLKQSHVLWEDYAGCELLYWASEKGLKFERKDNEKWMWKYEF